MSAEADGSVARISVLHPPENVLGSIFPPSLFSVHLYLFPPVMELDFITKGDGFHKVEIFLNLINYLFTHSPLPDGLQSARPWTTLSCNVKYTTAKQAVFFSWQYQTQMPTFLAHFLNCCIVVPAHTNDVCQAHEVASFRAFTAAFWNILSCQRLGIRSWQLHLCKE